MAYSQIYFTKSGHISFDATTPSSPEKVAGDNRTVTCVLDTKSGALQFSVLMKGFEFERALMQEHFNENYVESGKYEKADFKGNVLQNESITYGIDGTYPVKVKGILNMHGENKEVESDGKLLVKNGKINATAVFTVLLSDYKISIPGLVADKVAKVARISVDCSLELFKK
jgi:hypothetical protein